MQLTYQQQSKVACQLQRKNVSIILPLNLALIMERKNDVYMIVWSALANKVKFYVTLLTPCLVEATADDSASVSHNRTTGKNRFVYTCGRNVYSDNVLVDGAWPNCTFVIHMSSDWKWCTQCSQKFCISCRWLLQLQCSIH